MITREEERELVIKAKAGDREALGELLEAHKRFLYKRARGVGRGVEGDDLEDRVQDAAIAAMISLDSFDPDAGFRFLTYADNRIHWRLKRASAESGLVRVPQHVFNPSVGTDEHREAAKRVSRIDSIDSPVAGGDENGTLGALLGDRCGSRPLDCVAHAEEIERLRDAIALLPERMRDIVDRRLAGETREEVGAAYGITGERVRQLEARAHEALRRSLARSERPEIEPIVSRWPVEEAERIRIARPAIFIPRFRWTPDRDAFILRAATRYGAWRHVATLLGASPHAVRSRARRLGVQQPLRIRTCRDRVRELHAAGLPNKAIGVELGVDPETIRVSLREMGLASNPRDENDRMRLLRQSILAKYGVATPTEVRQKMFAERAAELGWPSLPYPSALIMAAFAKLGTATVYDLPDACRRIQVERSWHVGFSRQTAHVTVKKLSDAGLLERVGGGGNQRRVYRLKQEAVC